MIWFTSDTHFYHRNVIKFCNRPFKDLDEMHAALINNWNKRVKSTDTIYFLGDFAFAGMTKVKTLLSRLNGKKVLIWGNHDKEPHRMIEAGFDEAYQVHQVKIGNYTILLSHFPFAPIESYFKTKNHVHIKYEHSDLRHIHKRILDNGSDILICGHVHEKWKVRGRQINVGVDVWDFKPVSHEKILQLIKEIKGVKGS